MRQGLAGGGTDLSPYCDTHGGAILNATISRYAYANLSFRDDQKLCFSAHDVKHEDVVPLAAELSLDTGLILHRAVYNRIVRDFLGGRIHALTVTSTVDAPPGSGLGASSALVVALVEAYRSVQPAARQLRRGAACIRDRARRRQARRRPAVRGRFWRRQFHGIPPGRPRGG
ncbi:MAG: hypothetical protein WBE48_28150 [Xanthobacteraceae bacterium]